MMMGTMRRVTMMMMMMMMMMLRENEEDKVWRKLAQRLEMRKELREQERNREKKREILLIIRHGIAADYQYRRKDGRKGDRGRVLSLPSLCLLS